MRATHFAKEHFPFPGSVCRLIAVEASAFGVCVCVCRIKNRYRRKTIRPRVDGGHVTLLIVFKYLNLIKLIGLYTVGVCRFDCVPFVVRMCYGNKIMRVFHNISFLAPERYPIPFFMN